MDAKAQETHPTITAPLPNPPTNAQMKPTASSQLDANNSARGGGSTFAQGESGTSVGDGSEPAPNWGQLAREIEKLRNLLIKAVQEGRDLQREEVFQLSRRLDNLIVQAQQALANNRHREER